MDYENAPYIKLHWLEEIEPIAAARGVSRVARSKRGFLTSYKLASGEWTEMGRDSHSGQDWDERRTNFIKRHMGQVTRRREALWKRGEPTDRHLALMMWAYTPTPKKTLAWVQSLR